MKTITAFVVRTIALCIHYPRWVIAGAILLAVVSSWYAATHFSMTTDINQLISSNSAGGSGNWPLKRPSRNST